MGSNARFASHVLMDVRAIVGKNVRQRRIAAGLSQEELGARMGVEQYYISGLEAGRRNPTIATMALAAVALGVKISALFESSSRLDAPTKRKRKRKSVRER